MPGEERSRRLRPHLEFCVTIAGKRKAAMVQESVVSVRLAQPEDDAAAKAVDALATATLRRTYRPTRAALENKARLGDRLNRLVATSDGRVVGTVQWYLASDSLRIVGLGVHPDFRQRGVARELLAYLTMTGRKQGASRLRLYTIKETGNVDVFARLGFHVIVEREDQFFASDHHNALTEVEMEKPLAE